MASEVKVETSTVSSNVNTKVAGVVARLSVEVTMSGAVVSSFAVSSGSLSDCTLVAVSAGFFHAPTKISSCLVME